MSGMPDWRDDDFEQEEGEEWKPDPAREACKALYQQWKTIVMMMKGALDSMNTDNGDELSKDYSETEKDILLNDAYITGVKILSSETGGLYIIRMENASIIRKNAQSIKSALLGMMIDQMIEEHHGHAIRNEIDKFRELFKVWVSNFQRDEYEDEWGLFI